MQAAVLSAPSPIAHSPLQIEDVPTPEPKPGHVLLKVLSCGVCRTDLHIVEGELPQRMPRVIPGHQIVGEIVGGDFEGSSTARASAAGHVWKAGHVGTPGNLGTTSHGGTGVPTRPVKQSSTKLEALSRGTVVGVSWILKFIPPLRVFPRC